MDILTFSFSIFVPFDSDSSPIVPVSHDFIGAVSQVDEYPSDYGF